MNNLEVAHMLDEVLFDRKFKVDLLKINFPGCVKVLRGGSELIRNDAPHCAIKVGMTSLID